MSFSAIVFSSLALSSILSFHSSFKIYGQDTLAPPPPALPKPPPRSTPDPIVLQPIPEPPAVAPAITREQRAASYAKLLEGQRYFSKLQNSRSQIAVGAIPRLAKQAFAQAVEINPGLAEGYTALAELIGIAGGSAAQIERLAGYAVRFDPNNFGARRLLARIYAGASNLGAENFDRAAATKTVAAYREVVRLDSRNAEAWAVLSELYGALGQTKDQLEALQKWRGAAQPQEDRFYRSLTGRNLQPETAAIELGRAFIKANRIGEAIRVLTEAVAENPDENSFSALNDAIEAASSSEAAAAVNVLQQTVLENPANPALLELLITTQLRSGQTDAAVNVLRRVIQQTAGGDKNLHGGLLAKLGDVYSDAGRTSDAIAAYENALKAVEINNQPLAADAEREFAARVMPRLIAAYRTNGQIDRARETIVRLNALLGNTDATADEQLVELLRAIGDYNQALQTARDARKRFPSDAGLLRLEAEVLTDAGRVDEAATLLRSKIVNKSKQIAVPAALVNDFLSHLAVANLYTRVERGTDAVAAATQALDLAQNDQMTNIALLTLASAQNAASDFKAAEITLRQVIKQEPNNATALNNLGYFLVERGERLLEAVELINRAIAREPNNASFLDSLGWAHFKLGQLAEAEKYLLQAVRRNSNSAAIHEHLGNLYERQGKLNDARTAWRKALNLTKRAAEVQKLRAKLGETKSKNQ